MPKAGYWTNLRHDGVAFVPPYQPQGLRLRFKNELFSLGPLAEEMAYSWAKKKDTPYVKDSIYADNFWKDFSRGEAARELGNEENSDWVRKQLKEALDPKDRDTVEV